MSGRAAAPRRFIEAYLGTTLPDAWPVATDVDWRTPAEPRWTLTSGSAMEVSLSAGRDRAPQGLRYTLDLGAGVPTAGARLQLQLHAFETLAAALAGPRPSAQLEELVDVVEACFPESMRASSGPAFTLWVGVEHDPQVAGRLRTLKLYANLGWDGAALDRLWSERPELAGLARCLSPDLAAAAFLGLQTGDRTRPAAKLYFTPTRGAGHQALIEAAAAAGLSPRRVVEAVQAAGLAPCLWGPWTKLCLEADAAMPRLTMHLALAALDPVARTSVVERFAAAAGLDDAMRAVAAAAAVSGWPCLPTVAALGFGRDGVSKRSLYLAPPVPDQIRQAARCGSRGSCR